MPSGDSSRKDRAGIPAVATLRGRERELARIAELLANDDAPIVTLWGPGGIGKTSLALTAIRSARGFDDVAFASLSEDATAGDVLRSTAAALGAPITRARGAVEGARRLGDILASRGRVLLVLDNAETCIAAVAELVVRWRTQAPHTKLLVTSREPLGIMAEHVVEVPALSLRGLDDDPRTSDAAALLLERARAVRADFDPPADLLVQLVRSTEGIPLAIELCAARLDILSAAELAERLSKSRSILSTPRRDTEERHRTLFASIALSYRLLDDSERRTLSELVTIAEPFDLEAAEAIASGPSPLDVVESLVRKSLLRRHEHDGSTRISFYDSVRAFVRETAGADPRAERRHAAHFAARAARLAADADSLDGAAAVTKLASLEGEIATVLSRYVAEPRAELARDVAAGLLATHPLAMIRGPISTFVDRARALLGATPDRLHPSDRGRIESALGYSLFSLSDLEDARTILERAEAGLAAAGEPLERANALVRLGALLTEQGEYDASTRARQTAAEIAGDDPRIAGLCLLGSGRVAHVHGDLGEARERYARARELLHRADDARSEARTINNDGFLAYDDGDTVSARASFSEGLRLSQRLGDLRGAAFAIGYMGNTLRAEGAIDEALAHYEETVAVLRSAGDRFYEAVFRMDIGAACLLDGRVARARDELTRATQLTHDARDHHVGALIAGYMVAALAMSGSHVEAAATARAARLSSVGSNLLCLDAHEWTAKVLAGEHEDAATAAKRWLDESADPPPKVEHVRLARRILANVLAARASAEGALVLGRDRVRPPFGAWIDLSTRPVLVAIVGALAERRLSSPGAMLSIDEILAAGWPGERVHASAGAIRVRVAMASLRKLGLASVLGRAAGGYRFDPEVRVIDAREAPSDRHLTIAREA